MAPIGGHQTGTPGIQLRLTAVNTDLSATVDTDHRLVVLMAMLASEPGQCLESGFQHGSGRALAFAGEPPTLNHQLMN